MATKLYLVSYASDNMTISQKALEQSFLRMHLGIGYEKFTMGFTKSDIDSFFLYANKDVFAQSRGAGYWLWKPYVIMRALERIADGDKILYSDAGLEVISDLSSILNIEKDVTLFSNEWPHVEWCKMDVLKAVLPEKRFDHNHKQVQATNIVITKSEWSYNFIKEWLMWCQMPGFIDDTPLAIANVDTFQEHRHDQAILCCLAIKYDMPLHWWPAKFQEGARHLYHDSYGSVFMQHRKRNNEW